MIDIAEIQGRIEIEDLATGTILHEQRNALTDIHRQRYAEMVVGRELTLPNSIALSVKRSTLTESPNEKRSLNSEFQRDPIYSRLVEGTDTARLSALLDSEVTADVLQVGLFGGDSSIYDLHDCDSLDSIFSNATLSLDPTEKRAGTDSVKVDTVNRDASSRSFNLVRDYFPTDWRDSNTGDTISLDSENNHLQFWYFVSDLTLMEADPIVQMYADDTAGEEKYLEWRIDRNDLSANDWNWISLAFGDYTNKVGMGNAVFEGDRIDRIMFIIDPIQSTTTLVERFDQVQLARLGGDLWAVSDLATTFEKQAGVSLALNWYLSVTRGAGVAQPDPISFDTESFNNIGSTVTRLSAPKYQPPGGTSPASQARIWVTQGTVYYTTDGSTPTTGSTSQGVTGVFGDAIALYGADIADFRFIGTSSADADVVYYR